LICTKPEFEVTVYFGNDAITLETLPEAGLPPTIETEMMNAANAMPWDRMDVFVTVTVAPPKVPEPDTAVAVRT